MASRALPSPEVLRQLLRYEPETGKLFWKEREISHFDHTSDPAAQMARWNSRHAGAEALTCRQHWGHMTGSVLGINVAAHRVVWAIHHGSWPSEMIDHINGDASDNRIENLRDATPQENSRNQKRRRNNTSGVLGVNRVDGKWRAQIHHNGRNLTLGRFSTIEEAAAARKEAETMLGYHDNHGRRTPWI